MAALNHFENGKLAEHEKIHPRINLSQEIMFAFTLDSLLPLLTLTRRTFFPDLVSFFLSIDNTS